MQCVASAAHFLYEGEVIMKFRGTIAVALAAVMAASSPLAGVAYNGLSVTASAEKFVSNDYIYEGNGNNAVTITGYNGDNAVADIPDTLCGKRRG